MAANDELLALADELEGVGLKDDCESCLASGTSLCRGDLECAESAHKACAKRLREIVEHDAGEATTVSAYDLLPEDEREAIAWVREQGGLDAVKDAVKTNEWELSLAVIAHDALYGEKSERDTTPTEFKRELDKRLMPEGMEWLIKSWPRFDDNEPLRWDDEYVNGNGGVSPLRHVSLYADGRAMLGKGKVKVVLAPGERVKRPAPKSLDADGVEIRVGDVLYRKSDGRMAKVAEVYEKTFIDADGYVRPGDGFTHRAPVIVADGEPLEVGQTVWHVGNGVEFTVIRLPRSGEYQAVKLRLDDGAVTGFDPDQLTHQRPVLDADGNRIEPAMDVWWICEGDERGVHAERLRVEIICSNGLVECSPYNGGTWVYLEPSELYVNKPVPASDGKPLREGETVWDTNGDELVIVTIEDGGHTVTCRYVDVGDAIPVHGMWSPSQLTHTKPEPPDTWERIEEDCSISERQYYAQRIGHDVGLKDDEEVHVAVSRDLVRRCRALAERGGR